MLKNTKVKKKYKKVRVMQHSSNVRRILAVIMSEPNTGQTTNTSTTTGTDLCKTCIDDTWFRFYRTTSDNKPINSHLPPTCLCPQGTSLGARPKLNGRRITQKTFPTTSTLQASKTTAKQQVWALAKLNEDSLREAIRLNIIFIPQYNSPGEATKRLKSTLQQGPEKKSGRTTWRTDDKKYHERC